MKCPDAYENRRLADKGIEMVKQTKIVFSLGDIARIRLGCLNCFGGSILPFSPETQSLPHDFERCPSCREEWYGKAPGTQMKVLLSSGC